jgi:hypothetical protein
MISETYVDWGLFDVFHMAPALGALSSFVVAYFALPSKPIEVLDQESR